MALIYDICTSLVRQGFGKIIMVNGHNGNIPGLQTIGRKIKRELPDIGLALVSWWNLISDDIRKLRETQIGGILHACELETSAQLVIQPEKVIMNKAKPELTPPTPFKSAPVMDLFVPSSVTWFVAGRDIRTETGVLGDPTKASAEKGLRFLNSAIESLATMISEIRNY